MKDCVGEGTNAADPNQLIARARSALPQAYVPYSRFPVGAAVLDDKGRVFSGVNIENASYGLTICAERVAIFAALAAGARRISAVAVTAKKLKPVAPCGACRQVMAEFCDPKAPVFSDAGRGRVLTWTVDSLLPGPFTSKGLRRPRKVSNSRAIA